MKNYGKIFQEDFHKSSLDLPFTISVDRIYDTTSGFKGHSTIADFIVYKFPYQCYFELKSHDGHRLPFSRIRDNQFDGCLEKSKIDDVTAGVIINFRLAEKDQHAYFVDIRDIEIMKANFKKSITIDEAKEIGVHLPGTLKRTRYGYDLMPFLEELERRKNIERSGTSSARTTINR